ncbi:hypothetical protein B566_EDAN016947, partial [Ephemera danica]
MCSKPCGANCKNQKCNHVTGECTDGCGVDVTRNIMERNAAKYAAETAVVMELVIETQVTALMDAFRIGLGISVM